MEGCGGVEGWRIIERVAVVRDRLWTVAVEGSVGGYFVFQTVVEFVRLSQFVVLLLDTSQLIEQSCFMFHKDDNSISEAAARKRRTPDLRKSLIMLVPRSTDIAYKSFASVASSPTDPGRKYPRFMLLDPNQLHFADPDPLHVAGSGSASFCGSESASCCWFQIRFMLLDLDLLHFADPNPLHFCNILREMDGSRTRSDFLPLT